jgi:hypothetical protein
MSTWRRYTFTAAGDRVRDAHELIVRDGRDGDGAGLGVELDGRPIGRQAGAWVLPRWLRARRRGAALWVTKYGPGADPEGGRGNVLWTPRYGEEVRP